MISAGITTTAYGNNFGEMLQAFGIRAAVNSLPGCQAELVNFSTKAYHPYQKPGFESFAAKNVQKNKLFQEFRENELGLSDQPVSELTQENAPDFDVYVFGSDGIWNTSVWEVPEFFGSFVPTGKPKIAYSPSVGADPNGALLKREMFEKYIPSFDYLSVRERMHMEFVQQYAAPGKRVHLVCDPTLLHPRQTYEALAAKGQEPPKPDRPYIFFYQPHAADCAILSLVVKLARRFGYDVVHTFADIPSSVFPHESISARFAGPQEFLSYIRDAALVITRSYHAAIFSILFERPMYAFVDKKSGSRFVSLLSTLHMEDRLVYNFLRPEEASPEYDYTDALNNLADFKMSSMEYLKDALYGASRGLDN